MSLSVNSQIRQEPTSINSYEILNTGVKTVCMTSEIFTCVVYITEFDRLNKKITVKPLSFINSQCIEKAEQIRSHKLLASISMNNENQIRVKIHQRFAGSFKDFSLCLRFQHKNIPLGNIQVKTLSPDSYLLLTSVYNFFERNNFFSIKPVTKTIAYA